MSKCLSSIILNNKDIILDIERNGNIPTIVETLDGDFYIMITKNKNKNESFIEVHNRDNCILKTLIKSSAIKAFHEIDTNCIVSLEVEESSIKDINDTCPASEYLKYSSDVSFNDVREAKKEKDYIPIKDIVGAMFLLSVIFILIFLLFGKII